MRLSTKLLLNTSLVGLMMMFTGCVDDGNDGVDGTNGVEGTDGLTALIHTSVEAAGANCAEGGTRIDVGFDDDENGSLSLDEIFSTEYVCNGATGTDGIDATDGLTALLNTTVEPAGTNCTEGGVKIDVGVDDDANGTLEESEIDNTSYVCNGATGVDGVDGEDGEDGADGADGADGLSAAEAEEKCLLDAGGYKAIDIYTSYDVGTGMRYSTRTWLDRNLGASRVAENADDTLAFGNYYQWGRGADGHEINGSATTAVLADSITPNHPNFITITEEPGDWMTDGDMTLIQYGFERSLLWSVPSSDINPNQVCPCGYVVPSPDYFEEIAFDELPKLKLPHAGYREPVDGNYTETESGKYWTSHTGTHDTMSVTVDTMYEDGGYDTDAESRASGYPVRCVKPGLAIPRNLAEG